MSEVREAKIGDVEAFGRFILKAWDEARPGALGWTGATDENVSQLASAEFLSPLIEREGIALFLAWDRGEVVGFASNRRVDDETVELSGIVVLESMTGRGVGSRLLESSLVAAGRDGHGRVIVETEAFNERAIGFYRSRGFEVGEKRVTEVEGEQVELVELSLLLGT
jgi:ribosomal protein S18 acetylase RimI-like enzyme